MEVQSQSPTGSFHIRPQSFLCPCFNIEISPQSVSIPPTASFLNSSLEFTSQSVKYLSTILSQDPLHFDSPLPSFIDSHRSPTFASNSCAHSATLSHPVHNAVPAPSAHTSTTSTSGPIGSISAGLPRFTHILSSLATSTSPSTCTTTSVIPSSQSSSRDTTNGISEAISSPPPSVPTGGGDSGINGDEFARSSTTHDPSQRVGLQPLQPSAAPNSFYSLHSSLHSTTARTQSCHNPPSSSFSPVYKQSSMAVIDDRTASQGNVGDHPDTVLTTPTTTAATTAAAAATTTSSTPLATPLVSSRSRSISHALPTAFPLSSLSSSPSFPPSQSAPPSFLAASRLDHISVQQHFLVSCSPLALPVHPLFTPPSPPCVPSVVGSIAAGSAAPATGSGASFASTPATAGAALRTPFLYHRPDSPTRPVHSSPFRPLPQPVWSPAFPPNLASDSSSPQPAFLSSNIPEKSHLYHTAAAAANIKSSVETDSTSHPTTHASQTPLGSGTAHQSHEHHHIATSTSPPPSSQTPHQVTYWFVLRCHNCLFTVALFHVDSPLCLLNPALIEYRMHQQAIKKAFSSQLVSPTFRILVSPTRLNPFGPLTSLPTQAQIQQQFSTTLQPLDPTFERTYSHIVKLLHALPSSVPSSVLLTTTSTSLSKASSGSSSSSASIAQQTQQSHHQQSHFEPLPNATGITQAQHQQQQSQQPQQQSQQQSQQQLTQFPQPPDEVNNLPLPPTNSVDPLFFEELVSRLHSTTQQQHKTLLNSILTFVRYQLAAYNTTVAVGVTESHILQERCVRLHQASNGQFYPLSQLLNSLSFAAAAGSDTTISQDAPLPFQQSTTSGSDGIKQATNQLAHQDQPQDNLSTQHVATSSVFELEPDSGKNHVGEDSASLDSFQDTSEQTGDDDHNATKRSHLQPPASQSASSQGGIDTSNDDDEQLFESSPAQPLHTKHNTGASPSFLVSNSHTQASTNITTIHPAAARIVSRTPPVANVRTLPAHISQTPPVVDSTVAFFGVNIAPASSLHTLLIDARFLPLQSVSQQVKNKGFFTLPNDTSPSQHDAQGQLSDIQSDQLHTSNGTTSEPSANGGADFPPEHLRLSSACLRDSFASQQDPIALDVSATGCANHPQTTSSQSALLLLSSSGTNGATTSSSSVLLGPLPRPNVPSNRGGGGGGGGAPGASTTNTNGLASGGGNHTRQFSRNGYLDTSSSHSQYPLQSISILRSSSQSNTSFNQSIGGSLAPGGTVGGALLSQQHPGQQQFESPALGPSSLTSDVRIEPLFNDEIHHTNRPAHFPNAFPHNQTSTDATGALRSVVSGNGDEAGGSTAAVSRPLTHDPSLPSNQTHNPSLQFGKNRLDAKQQPAATATAIPAPVAAVRISLTPSGVSGVSGPTTPLSPVFQPNRGSMRTDSSNSNRPGSLSASFFPRVSPFAASSALPSLDTFPKIPIAAKQPHNTAAPPTISAATTAAATAGAIPAAVAETPHPSLVPTAVGASVSTPVSPLDSNLHENRTLDQADTSIHVTTTGIPAVRHIYASTVKSNDSLMASPRLSDNCDRSLTFTDGVSDPRQAMDSSPEESLRNSQDQSPGGGAQRHDASGIFLLDDERPHPGPEEYDNAAFLLLGSNHDDESDPNQDEYDDSQDEFYSEQDDLQIEHDNSGDDNDETTPSRPQRSTRRSVQRVGVFANLSNGRSSGQNSHNHDFNDASLLANDDDYGPEASQMSLPMAFGSFVPQSVATPTPGGMSLKKQPQQQQIQQPQQQQQQQQPANSMSQRGGLAGSIVYDDYVSGATQQAVVAQQKQQFEPSSLKNHVSFANETDMRKFQKDDDDDNDYDDNEQYDGVGNDDDQYSGSDDDVSALIDPKTGYISQTNASGKQYQPFGSPRRAISRFNVGSVHDYEYHLSQQFSTELMQNGSSVRQPLIGIPSSLNFQQSSNNVSIGLDQQHDSQSFLFNQPSSIAENGHDEQSSTQNEPRVPIVGSLAKQLFQQGVLRRD